MHKPCLDCGATNADIFAPCTACGARPGDVRLRRKGGKAEFEREQGRDTFLQHLEHRSKSATALQEDLRKEVPLLYGSPATNEGYVRIELARLVREDAQRRYQGGVPPFRPYRRPRLLLELALVALLFLFLYSFVRMP